MAPRDTAGDGAARARISPNLTMTIRRWHTYVGALIAPSVLFFAVTGAVQLYGLHESREGYRAPALIRSLSAIHKDQTSAPPPERPARGGAEGGRDRGPPAAKTAPPISTPVLKAFYLAVSAGLIVSTLMGVWMAVAFGRRKRLIWALLILGAALPVAILAL